LKHAKTGIPDIQTKQGGNKGDGGKTVQEPSDTFVGDDFDNSDMPF
jgi:hypothetical protein